MFYTNDNGSTWGQTGAIAVYIEGTAPPIANAVTATVAYGSVGNVIPLNITGGPPTSVTVASAPSHGTATAGGTSITYTPTPGYFGPDSFTYTATNAEGTSAPATVTITVNPQVPVANAVFATVSYGSVANVITLSITGEMLTSVAVVSAASHGTATASGTSITYTPASGYFGPDGFAYTATNAGGTSAPATVTITVNPQPPVANAVSATVAYGSVANVITLSLTGGTPTSVAISTPASHGTATASGIGITYTPALGYSGPDSLTYTATNVGGTSAPATVTITVNPQAPAANAVSATVAYNSSGNVIPLNITGGTPTSVSVASAASHGTATASGTSITYTPAVGYSGPDSFTYTATNAGGTSAPATVTITVIEHSDGDNISDSEEQGPDGNVPAYDGNGDGIPDWLQGNVLSFHTHTQDGDKPYITLEIPSGQYVEYLYAPWTFDATPPEGVSFPYGLVSFTLAGLPAGGATTVTIYLDGAPPQTYYKYGKTPDNREDHWYEFSYDGQTGAEVVGNTVVLHFVDGKRGDHDLELDGSITDPGGPAEIEPHAGLYFPYLVSTSHEKTEIGIINTRDYTSTSTISYYGENGDLIKTATITLAPKGKATISAAQIPQNAASAVVTGDGDPVGYTRYLGSAGKRCAWSAATYLQKIISVPHTAVNAEWATAICLFNPNDGDVEVTLIYESGVSGKFTLNAKSRKFLQLAEEESVISINCTGYISGMEMFDSLIPGGDAGALLLRDRSLNALYVPSILYDSGDFTGIGLKSHCNGTVNVTGHNAAGETEEVSFGTQPLGTQTSQSRMAFNLSGMLGHDNLWAKISGEGDFSTPFGTPSLNFQGIAIYGEEHIGKVGAVNLNAMRFREGFIGIGATASETTLTLLNPGTTQAEVTMTGYSASGEVMVDSTMKIASESTWAGTVNDLFDGTSPASVTHVKIASDMDLYGFETISTDGRMEMLPVMGMD